MSVMTRIGVRSLPLSVLEVGTFLALSAAYFVGVPKVYSSIWQAGAPIWLWVAMGLVYLLIVTVWWAPGHPTWASTSK